MGEWAARQVQTHTAYWQLPNFCQPQAIRCASFIPFSATFS